MKHPRMRIYDNGGKTFDRYTFVFPSLDVPHHNDYCGSSENPFHPQGFGQHCGEYPRERSYRHLGKLISPSELPEQARKFFEQEVRAYEKAKKMLCTLREELLEKGLGAPITLGTERVEYIYDNTPMKYRWTDETREQFQVKHRGRWWNAEHIDFESGG